LAYEAEMRWFDTTQGLPNLLHAGMNCHWGDLPIADVSLGELKRYMLNLSRPLGQVRS